MTTSSEIRAQLSHPVIDADGPYHRIHVGGVCRLRSVAGGELAKKIFSSDAGNPVAFAWHRMSDAERRRERPPWWGLPSENIHDRATAMLPKIDVRTHRRSAD